MGELLLIGMGLHDENGLSLRGLDAARSADAAYVEFYTSIMPGLSVQNLERLLGKHLVILSRKDLEENAEAGILSNAKHERVALLTPGDPMSATTHVGLLLSARKHGIRTTVIHSSSIATAAAGVSGLELYKFGRTVTIPSPKTNPFPESIYEFIKDNKRIGLHTLALLDIEGKLMIPEAIRILLSLEESKKDGVTTRDTLMVGLARVESPDHIVQADRAASLLERDFGEPPHSIIVPGKLHFMEAEALELLAGAPRIALEGQG